MEKWLEETQNSLKTEFNLELTIEQLSEVLTHPSYKIIDPESKNYQRLETYGDAVLDLIVTGLLFEEFPNYGPEDLTKNRSILVNNSTLGGVGKYLKLQKGLRCNPSYSPNSKDLAEVVEALFGLICFSYGFQKAKEFYLNIKSIFEEISKSHPNLALSHHYNPIGRLQEHTQKAGLPLPYYEFTKSGKDHKVLFTVYATVNTNLGLIEIFARGKSKNHAKAIAASILLKKIEKMASQNSE